MRRIRTVTSFICIQILIDKNKIFLNVSLIYSSLYTESSFVSCMQKEKKLERPFTSQQDCEKDQAIAITGN